MDTDQLLEHVRIQRLFVDYACIAAVALYIYDYFLTIEREINLIWFSSWTYTKIMYIGTRYLPMVSTFFLVHEQLFFNTQDCERSFIIATCFSGVGLVFAEIILALRTWAVLNRNRKIGCALALLMTGANVVDWYFIAGYIKSVKFAPPPYESYRGCYVVEISNAPYIAFCALAVLDAIVLSLMAYSAMTSYRFGDNLRLSNIIHRDGILFYVYLLGITAASATVTRFASKLFVLLLLPLQDTIYSVLTTRVILNIREAARRDVSTELHFTYQDTFSPVRFEPVDAQN